MLFLNLSLRIAKSSMSWRARAGPSICKWCPGSPTLTPLPHRRAANPTHDTSTWLFLGSYSKAGLRFRQYKLKAATNGTPIVAPLPFRAIRGKVFSTV